MYDKTKLNEYKFRAVVSVFLLCLISYLVFFNEMKGPGIFEIVFIGGLFSILSLIHSVQQKYKIPLLLPALNLRHDI